MRLRPVPRGQRRASTHGLEHEVVWALPSLLTEERHYTVRSAAPSAGRADRRQKDAAGPEPSGDT